MGEPSLLAGVRVVESGALLNAGTVGMLLGDQGADVIKLEMPPMGDYLRDLPGTLGPRNSLPHLQVNRNKRSIIVDLRHPAGKEIFWRLAATADVFVDGNLPGALERLGVGYEAQRTQRSDVVYCHYTGFGAVGPYATIPTHSAMMNALAGAMPTRVGADGLLELEPRGDRFPGTEIGGEATATGAVHAAFNVASALVRRATTGEGCYIDVAASDAVVAGAATVAAYALNEDRLIDGVPAYRWGGMPGARYQFYETRDERAVLIGCLEDKFWEHLCDAVGRDDLRVATDDDPPDAVLVLRRELQSLIGARDLAEWMQIAVAHDIPMCPAPRSVVEVSSDPHVASRGLFVQTEHPLAGPMLQVASPRKLDGADYVVRAPAPRAGEHTIEVLTGLGFEEAEVHELGRLGVVAGPGVDGTVVT